MPNDAFPVMEDIRRKNQMIDVTIVVGDKKQKIDAHRLVLAATIPYFTAMFTHDMAESRQKEIVLDGHGGTIDPGAFESLINFAYSGKVTISTSNVQNLMMTASFLQLSRVRDACAEFLMAKLCPSNVLGARSFADTLGCTSLVMACQKFIKKFFSRVAETEEFLALTVEELAEVVGEDELFVSTEEEVFNAVLRWVKFNPEERQDSLALLLAKVRLPLLTPQFLSDIVAAEDLIRSSHRCRYLIFSIIKIKYTTIIC
jgi:kelch-like protein 18